MIDTTKAFSSFSVDNVERAKKFYEEKLGVKTRLEKLPGCGNMLTLILSEQNHVLVYEKPDHRPASFTVLNFEVSNIEDEVKSLRKSGIQFENYDGTDELGINHNEGPLIAWFKDPAGNFISVMQEETVSKSELRMKTFIPDTPEEVFKYFTKPALLETWAYPEGMTLKVPQFEAKKNGHYRYEHTNEQGQWLCVGILKEFVPAEKLTSVDKVLGPDGNLLLNDQESELTFKKVGRGTEIQLKQGPFPDEKFKQECEKGWEDSFRHLKAQFGIGMQDSAALHMRPDELY